MRKKKLIEVDVSTTPVETVLPSGKVLTAESEDERLVAVLMKLDASDKDALKRALEQIVSVRLANELKVGQGIGVGVLSNNISIQDAALLMNKSKDSLSDLIKIVQLLDGKATSNNEITVTIRDEIASQVRLARREALSCN